MLVDDDMLPWLLRDGLSIERGPNVNSRDMPPDLSLEVSCYFHGEGKGRYVARFHTLRRKLKTARALVQDKRH